MRSPIIEAFNTSTGSNSEAELSASESYTSGSDQSGTITYTDILTTLDKARKSDRKRAISGITVKDVNGDMRILLGENSPYQSFLNTFLKGTYVQPHKHTDKDESFTVLWGEIKVIEFDDNGKVTSTVILGHSSADKDFALHKVIAKDRFHAIVSLSKFSAVLENKEGAYDAVNDKKCADWAFAESGCAQSDEQDINRFLEWLTICKEGQEAKNYRSYLEAKNYKPCPEEYKKADADKLDLQSMIFAGGQDFMQTKMLLMALEEWTKEATKKMKEATKEAVTEIKQEFEKREIAQHNSSYFNTIFNCFSCCMSSPSFNRPESNSSNTAQSGNSTPVFMKMN